LLSAIFEDMQTTTDWPIDPTLIDSMNVLIALIGMKPIE
jgi:hypothetical protein